MALIKPNIDGKGATSGYYDGLPPTPATYSGEVSKLGLGKIQSGDNAGEDKLIVIVKITAGKFKGAEIFHQLPILKQSAWSLNQFLHSLTDGSEKQKETIEKWFYDVGYDTEPEAKNEKLGRQINYIGKSSFKPIGKKTAFVTKMDGERAVISKFVVPLEGSGSEEPEEEVAVASDDGILDAAVVEDNESAVVTELEPAAVADDDDDPWG